MSINYDVEYPALQKRFYASNRRIAELEAENNALHRMLTADPDRGTSTGAAQAAMEYQIYLRNSRIAELEAKIETGRSAYSDLLLISANEIRKLEAEIAELKSNLRSMTDNRDLYQSMHDNEFRRAEKAEATIERVKALQRYAIDWRNEIEVERSDGPFVAYDELQAVLEEK